MVLWTKDCFTRLKLWMTVGWTQRQHPARGAAKKQMYPVAGVGPGFTGHFEIPDGVEGLVRLCNDYLDSISPMNHEERQQSFRCQSPYVIVGRYPLRCGVVWDQRGTFKPFKTLTSFQRSL